ncbi:ComEA family DNA-binding protein [Microbulbifer guangxiensis]|uniref:ComEA family DNA-binding protein n=1 Tax=Microbulbifer guangxiensis TaxID=2904249 RepID=UPI0034E22728
MKAFRTHLIAILASLLFVLSGAAALAEDTGSQETLMAAITVNVNSASAEELAEKLDGVGESRAQGIVEYREEHGPFTSVEQLLEVKGIGVATLDKNRARIQL